MAQRQTWFATNADAELIKSWLREAGAIGANDYSSDAGISTQSRELLLHFPQIGPIEYWPDEIRPSDYEEGTDRWRKAIIADNLKRQSPGCRLVDCDRSAVAGLRLPELRDGMFLVSGCLSFPGSRLLETFPELARICQRFERFVRGFKTVYIHPKRESKGVFDYQLCMTSIAQRVVALPEAYALLAKGAFMIDHETSPENYRNFRRRLQLSGHIPIE